MAYIGSQVSAYIGGDVQAILSQQWIRTAVTYGAWAATALTWNPPPVYVAGVPVSVRMQESYQYKSEATMHAIEDGNPFTDHVILSPLVVTIVCELGNWYPGFAEYSLNLLEKMWKERSKLTLITAHKSIDNMVLTGLRADNEAQVWKALHCELTFQEIPEVKVDTQAYSQASTTGTTGKTSTPDVPKSAADSSNKGQVSLNESETVF